ncbi:MAG: hypothetical protein DRZ79_05750 [Candidatus Cloacimonadota bacterium]|nr:MAG: hypothetical protein DRZ79_05750 [Candidatus Cloacimonadota bacterium]
MKKIIIFLALFFVIVGIVNAAESVALALQVKGEVELIRNKTAQKVSIGQELVNKDTLETREDSYAAIKFIDGSSIVKLFPNSILTINTEKKNNKLNKKSYLKMGELWTKVMKKTGAFEIETPTTVVSVKGTKFLLGVGKAGNTQLFTFEGVVQIKNKFDKKTSLVTAGNKCFVDIKGNLLISKIQKGDIGEKLQNLIDEDNSEKLEIELENKDGETKRIEIEFK